MKDESKFGLSGGSDWLAEERKRERQLRIWENEDETRYFGNVHNGSCDAEALRLKHEEECAHENSRGRAYGKVADLSRTLHSQSGSTAPAALGRSIQTVFIIIFLIIFVISFFIGILL